MEWADYHYLREPPLRLAPGEENLFERTWEDLRVGGRPPSELDSPRHRFLQWLAATHRVLLHGSNDPAVEEFEPRRQTDFEGREIEAVFATPDPIWPIFFAVVDRSAVDVLRNGCLREDGRGSYFFAVAGPEGPRWRSGTVYVLPGSGFTPGYADLEWTSPQPVAPLARIAVEPADFPFLDDVLTFEAGEPEERFVARISAACAP